MYYKNLTAAFEIKSNTYVTLLIFFSIHTHFSFFFFGTYIRIYIYFFLFFCIHTHLMDVLEEYTSNLLCETFQRNGNFREEDSFLFYFRIAKGKVIDN